MTDESYFKFRGRNVPLDILEDWYQKKMISSEDSVEIAENSDGPFVEYKLKTLITLYGVEFPFRRMRREQWDPYSSSSDSSSDGESDVRLPSEPLFSSAAPLAPIKMGGRFPPPKSLKHDSVPSDIAPQTVKKPLATVAPMEREPPAPEAEAPSKAVAPNKMTVYFDYPLFNLDNQPQDDLITGADVEREMSELKTLCTTSNLENLSEFEFCRKHFYIKTKGKKMTCRLCGTLVLVRAGFLTHLFSEKHVGELRKRRVSLSSFDFYTRRLEKKLSHFPFDRFPLLNPNTGCGPSRIPLDVIINSHKPSAYLSLVSNTVLIPEWCKLCDVKLTEKARKHVFSKKHFSKLQQLEGIDPREIYFWYNLMSIRQKMSETKIDMRKLLFYQNQIPVALIDYRVDALNILSQDQRIEELKQLEEQWSTVPKDAFEKASFNEFQQNPKIRCWFCNFANFKSRTQLFDHIFTEKHLQYLTTFGYSEDALTAVKRKFEAATKVTARKAPPKSQCQTSRVPMLDAPPSKAKTANQAQFVEALRFIETSLEREVQAAAARKFGNFTCNYCPHKLTFNTELQVLHHIISQRHKEHMKFGTSSDDLDYWVKLLEGYKKPIVVNSDSITNNPRVPLLDPATSKLADEQTFHTMMNKARTSFASGGQAVLNLVKTKAVMWKCSFCPNVKKLQTELMAFAHITCKKHCENAKKLSSLEDLEHWNNWVNNLLVEAAKETGKNKCATEKPRAQNSEKSGNLREVTHRVFNGVHSQNVGKNDFVANQEDPIPPLDVSSLPLFAVSQTRQFADCFEYPTMHMLRTVAENLLPENRTKQLNSRVFSSLAICPYCNVDMTNFLYYQVIGHVFSVCHIHKFRSANRGEVSQDDYNYWLSFLPKSQPRDAYSTTQLFIDPMHVSLSPGAVFINFTRGEREMIEKFEGPIEPDQCRILIRHHAACLCCNNWTLDPVEIVKHLLSDQHIQQARMYRPVRQAEVDRFMHYVRSVQPSVFDKCNIM